MKTLAQMTLQELWQLFPIQVERYNNQYPTWYAAQAERFSQLLGEDVARISHIGSTAVPSLDAKAIVDILLELTPEADLLQLEEVLDREGWICMQRKEEPWQQAWNKGYTPLGFAEQVYHLHIRYREDPDELYFRDYLREHPEAREEYAALKHALAGPYRHDRDGYTAAKGDFVQTYTKKARQAYKGRYV